MRLRRRQHRRADGAAPEYCATAQPRNRRHGLRIAAGAPGRPGTRLGTPAASHHRRRHRHRRCPSFSLDKETLIMRPLIHTALRAAALALALTGAAAQAQNAICYNCPPEWADWGTQLKAIKQATGINVPADNKNSGQSLASIAAEKRDRKSTRLNSSH